MLCSVCSLMYAICVHMMITFAHLRKAYIIKIVEELHRSGVDSSKLNGAGAWGFVLLLLLSLSGTLVLFGCLTPLVSAVSGIAFSASWLLLSLGNKLIFLTLNFAESHS